MGIPGAEFRQPPSSNEVREPSTVPTAQLIRQAHQMVRMSGDVVYAYMIRDLVGRLEAVITEIKRIGINVS